MHFIFIYSIYSIYSIYLSSTGSVIQENIPQKVFVLLKAKENVYDTILGLSVRVAKIEP